MKLLSCVIPSLLATACLHALPVLGFQPPSKDGSDWNIKEVYQHLSVMGDELPKEEVARYCEFLIDCQEPEHGIFADKFENTIYSVKAHYLLKRFGYEPKHPLSVCQHVGKDLHYSKVDGQIISEQSDPKLFRKWLDKTRATYDAYAAGSLIFRSS